jgi:hypothetical protein
MCQESAHPFVADSSLELENLLRMDEILARAQEWEGRSATVPELPISGERAGVVPMDQSRFSHMLHLGSDGEPVSLRV